MLASHILLFSLAAVLRGTTAIKCNGLTDICDLRIDQVTFPGSHNAGSGFDGMLHLWSDGQVPSCSARNHGKSFTEQLEFGIRYFDIDSCYGTNEAVNCHCNDFLGCVYTGSIEKGLLQIDSWMKSNPNEVIVILFNRNAQKGYQKKIAKSIESILLKLWEPDSANELAMSTYYDNNNRWPTVKEAISSNQRIFLFMDNKLYQHIIEPYDWLVKSNGIIATTWRMNPVSFSCSAITTNADDLCDTNSTFIELSAFGSYGLCTWDMATLCSKWLGEAQEACYAKRPQGMTVNFLAVDWSDYYYGEESVVNKAKFMNQKNIKEFLDRDVFFPELAGCSYHPGWFYNYCWKDCPEYGWCWINEYCGDNANKCKEKDYSCYSECGY